MILLLLLFRRNWIQVALNTILCRVTAERFRVRGGVTCEGGGWRKVWVVKGLKSWWKRADRQQDRTAGLHTPNMTV